MAAAYSENRVVGVDVIGKGKMVVFIKHRKVICSLCYSDIGVDMADRVPSFEMYSSTNAQNNSLRILRIARLQYIKTDCLTSLTFYLKMLSAS